MHLWCPLKMHRASVRRFAYNRRLLGRYIRQSTGEHFTPRVSGNHHPLYLESFSWEHVKVSSYIGCSLPSLLVSYKITLKFQLLLAPFPTLTFLSYLFLLTICTQHLPFQIELELCEGRGSVCTAFQAGSSTQHTAHRRCSQLPWTDRLHC